MQALDAIALKKKCIFLRYALKKNKRHLNIAFSMIALIYLFANISSRKQIQNQRRSNVPPLHLVDTNISIVLLHS